MSIGKIPHIWADKLAEYMFQPTLFEGLVRYRDRTWKERLMSWPWKPWKKRTVDTTPPLAGDAGPRIAIVQVPGPKYVAPTMSYEIGDVCQWTPSGRGATVKIKAKGWKKPAPAGDDTGLQIVLTDEENKWLD